MVSVVVTSFAKSAECALLNLITMFHQSGLHGVTCTAHLRSASCTVRKDLLPLRGLQIVPQCGADLHALLQGHSCTPGEHENNNILGKYDTAC